MSGVNKVILVGHLGKDPEMRYQQDGTAVANFSIATSEEWKDKQTGEKKERTEWHRIVAWRRLGEICGEYLSKGSQVYIEGKLQTQQYERDGITRYTTNIVASVVKFLGGGGGNGGQRSSRGNHSQYDDGGYPEPPPMDRYEDDIPF